MAIRGKPTKPYISSTPSTNRRIVVIGDGGLVNMANMPFTTSKDMEG